ncbi:MAG: HEAT repeat domain-containing protein [Planctomycetota bacterium]
MFTRNTIFLIAALIALVLIPPVAQRAAAQDEATTEPEIDPKLQNAINELDSGIKALDAGNKTEALTHLDNMLKGLTPETAHALLAATGHQPFTRLYNEGGPFKKIARTISEMAAEENFRQQTDPAVVAELVKVFLSGEDAAVADAYHKLKYETGEFAVQPLIDAWSTAPDTNTRSKIGTALVSIGPRITMPLIAALSTKDTVLKQTIIDALVDSKDWRAAPVLKSLAEDENQPEDVRADASKAAEIIIRAHLTTVDPASLSALDLYTMVAEDYFAARATGPRAVIPLYTLREKRATFIWSFADGKIRPTEVAPVTASEEAALQMAAKALQLKPDHQPAYALLIASHLAELAEGEGMLELDRLHENQLMTDASRQLINATLNRARKNRAWIYAGGQSALYDALDLALNHSRQEAAVRCMREIIDTFAGGPLKHLPMTPEQLGAKGFYGSSLIRALNSDEKPIAYMAAIALANISSGAPFLNHEKVGKLLINAMEEGGNLNALVAHMKQEVRNALRATLKAMGFSVKTAGGSTDGLQAATDFPLPDIIILDNELDGDTGRFLERLRDNALTRATPVLIISSTDKEVLERDKRRYNYFESVKGYITDFADADQVKSLVGQLKKVSSPEAARNEALVAEAGELVAGLKPAHSIIDIASHSDRLLAIATDGSEFETRIQAITALGNWRIERALAPLAKTFADKAVPVEIRLAAAASTAKILATRDCVDDETFGMLKTALADEKKAVRDAAGEILARVSLSADQKKALIP